MLVDNAHRTDNRTTAQAEVVASLARVLLTVQRLGQAQSLVIASHRLQEHDHTSLKASNNNN